MARLSDEIKEFIVRELAVFCPPSQIAADVRKTYGVEVTRQQVHAYHPHGNKGRDLARRWRELFEETRRAFLEEVSSIPIAHQAYRLRELERAHAAARDVGNLPLAAKLLEQAAKECGGYFIRGGVTPPFQREDDLTKLSDEALDRLLLESLEAVFPNVALAKLPQSDR